MVTIAHTCCMSRFPVWYTLQHCIPAHPCHFNGSIEWHLYFGYQRTIPALIPYHLSTNGCQHPTTSADLIDNTNMVTTLLDTSELVFAPTAAGSPLEPSPILGACAPRVVFCSILGAASPFYISGPSPGCSDHSN